VLGNRNGDVTVVEFFDYRCPYCKRAAPVLDEVIKADGRVRRVMKEFPILGPDSVIASRAALAARAQGKYEELHRALIGARGQLDESAVMAAAKGVGLDLDRLRRDMRSTEIDGIIRRNRELAESLEITGTPAFVIGDAFLPGAADAATFRSLIQKARGG
jgi:protein-disulfide isomerase